MQLWFILSMMQVGSLLDALDSDELEDTIIVFYSDNGGNIHCGLEETDTKGEKYVTAITSNYPLRGGKGGYPRGRYSRTRSRGLARCDQAGNDQRNPYSGKRSLSHDS
jgi:arylsulfatase A-like enzyme